MQVIGASQVTEISNKTEQRTQKDDFKSKEIHAKCKARVYLSWKTWKMPAAQKYKTTNLQRKLVLFKQKRVQ